MANENEIKKDCFAYNKDTGECKACKKLQCEDCKFYKTSNKSRFTPRPFSKELSGYTVADVVHLFSKN